MKYQILFSRKIKKASQVCRLMNQALAWYLLNVLYMLYLSDLDGMSCNNRNKSSSRRK